MLDSPADLEKFFDWSCWYFKFFSSPYCGKMHNVSASIHAYPPKFCNVPVAENNGFSYSPMPTLIFWTCDPATQFGIFALLSIVWQLRASLLVVIKFLCIAFQNKQYFVLLKF